MAVVQVVSAVLVTVLWLVLFTLTTSDPTPYDLTWDGFEMFVAGALVLAPLAALITGPLLARTLGLAWGGAYGLGVIGVAGVGFLAPWPSQLGIGDDLLFVLSAQFGITLLIGAVAGMRRSPNR